ncbi:MAG: dihydrofolate reductase family protein [Fervidobacterium sp.]|nr:dihydrofolate reductase family protein [Fervidobacterium sp.]
MRVRLLAVTDIRGTIALSEFDKIDWSSKEDKQFFKKITMQSGVVIMGRKTFETIGKKLPQRVNVVLTHNSEYVFGDLLPDVVLSGNCKKILQDLLELGYNDVCVIGGQSVFTQFVREGAVTDLYLSIEPIVLPSGINLFSNEILKKMELKLENILKLNDKGTINVHYVVKRDV